MHSSSSSSGSNSSSSLRSLHLSDSSSSKLLLSSSSLRGSSSRLLRDPSRNRYPIRKFFILLFRVQFRVSADNEDYGVINLELFDEVVPRTVANFVSIASGQNQQGFSYKDTIFHRIIPQFMLQGGDFERFDGTGGQSIYGPKFDDENFLIKHASPGEA